MHKIWFGLAFAAIIAKPASGQDYQKNFVECTKELGLQPDAGYVPTIRAGPCGTQMVFPKANINR
jgi:hypothetical protein